MLAYVCTNATRQLVLYSKIHFFAENKRKFYFFRHRPIRQRAYTATRSFDKKFLKQNRQTSMAIDIKHFDVINLKMHMTLSNMSSWHRPFMGINYLCCQIRYRWSKLAAMLFACSNSHKRIDKTAHWHCPPVLLWLSTYVTSHH